MSKSLLRRLSPLLLSLACAPASATLVSNYALTATADFGSGTTYTTSVNSLQGNGTTSSSAAGVVASTSFNDGSGSLVQYAGAPMPDGSFGYSQVSAMAIGGSGSGYDSLFWTLGAASGYTSGNSSLIGNLVYGISNDLFQQMGVSLNFTYEYSYQGNVYGATGDSGSMFGQNSLLVTQNGNTVFNLGNNASIGPDLSLGGALAGQSWSTDPNTQGAIVTSYAPGAQSFILDLGTLAFGDSMDVEVLVSELVSANLINSQLISGVNFYASLTFVDVSAASVPEPATIALLLGAMLIIARRKRPY